jgi:hypothetical protein
MARTRVLGAVNRDTNYEVLAKKPIDARSLVKTYDDLTNIDNWINSSGNPIVYNGMIVAVWLNTADPSRNGIYFLHDVSVTNAKGTPDATNEANWHKLVDFSELADLSTRLSEIEGSLTEDIAANAKAILDEISRAKAAEAQLLVDTKAYTDNLVATSIVIEKKDSVDYLVLKNAAGDEVASVDATLFVKDGMLESAIYNKDTKKLLLTWNTVAGVEATEIDLNGLVNTYTSGAGINISPDGVISVDTSIATTKALNEVRAAVAAAQTEEQVAEAITAAIVDYVKITDVNVALELKADKTDFDSYYTKEAIDNKGFAVAADVAKTYATKEDFEELAASSAEFIKATDVAAAYATKEALAAHNASAENTYAKKAEVYTTAEVDSMIAGINQGNQESASAVNTKLINYIASNDKEIENLKVKDAELVAAVAAAQAKADQSAEDAKKVSDDVAALINNEIKSQSEDISAIKDRLAAFEETNSNQELRINTAEGKIVALEEAGAQFTSNLAEVNATLAGHATSIDEHSAKVAELIATVSKSADAIEKNTSDISALNDTIAAIVQPKASAEISVADDGTLGINEMNVNKLTQTEGDTLVLNGGSSSIKANS